MGTNIYDASKYAVKQMYGEQNCTGKAVDNWNEGDVLNYILLPQHKAIGVWHFPVQKGKTYLVKLGNKPTVTGTDSVEYAYDCINFIVFHRSLTNCTAVNIKMQEIECHYTKTGNYIGTTKPATYTGDRDMNSIGYLETDYTSRVRIVDANDIASTNAPTSKGAKILGNKTDAVYITILSDDIKYLSFNVLPKDSAVHGIDNKLPNPTSAVMTSLQEGIIIEEVEEPSKATVFVKGEPVNNATSYELMEKTTGGVYNLLATAAEINFEVSSMGLGAGDHVLVVKAKANGYEDSNYSNEVVYSV